jgi:predicted ATPase
VQREWLQTRLLDALLGVLRRLAEREPVLLVVEDVHWADPATRDAIAFLVRSTRPDRLLLTLTLRSDELHRRHPVLPWLAELERSGRIDRIDLPRLDSDDTAAMLEEILGSAPDPDLVERVHRRSDGNPFFIEELLAAEETASGHVPTTLQGILLARLAAVPETAQGVLAIVAVAGRRIDHDLLAEVAGAPESHLLDALRAAVSSGILVADADRGSREGYAFRHALLAR